MQVTEVDIAFVKSKDGLIAFASLVVDDQLYLSGIAGEAQFSLFHPIRKPIGLAIERAIFEKLKDVMSKHDAGHDRLDAGSASV